VVSKFGRSIQGCESFLQKFLYGVIFARAEVYGKMLEGSWPVSMKIALSIKNGRQQFLLSLELFFSTQALLKNRGACVDTQNWQEPTGARQAG
jgi:hypothetical protein